MNSPNSEELKILRNEMVENQLLSNGIVQSELIEAFMNVPRHLFVPEEYRESSYNDSPLPIGYSQTISQPYVVAYMLQQLKLENNHHVLEVGTGSGYQTALLLEMGCNVVSVELVGELSTRAERIISSLGYEKVIFKVANGYFGCSEYSPYDRIVVSAASKEVPPSLIGQLTERGGQMIIPVGKKSQRLIHIIKNGESVEKKSLKPVKFVPLVNKN